MRTSLFVLTINHHGLLHKIRISEKIFSTMVTSVSLNIIQLSFTHTMAIWTTQMHHQDVLLIKMAIQFTWEISGNKAALQIPPSVSPDLLKTVWELTILRMFLTTQLNKVVKLQEIFKFSSFRVCWMVIIRILFIHYSIHRAINNQVITNLKANAIHYMQWVRLN